MKLVIATFAVLLALSACGGEAEVERDTITIGLMMALDSFPIIAADELGFFEAEGLNVNIEIFASGAERDVAFQVRDDLDGIMFDFVALASFREAGFDVVVPSNILGLSAIVGVDGIETIEDLHGGSALLAFNSAMHFILYTALLQAGMTEDDVVMTAIPVVPTRMEMLLNNQAEAALLPEPFVSLARHQGLNIVATTRDLGINPFGLGFRREAMQQKTWEFQAFFRAINNMVDYLNATDDPRYVDMLIDRAGFPEVLRGNMTMPEFTRFEPPRAQDIDAVFDFVRVQGFLTAPVTAHDVLFDPFASN